MGTADQTTWNPNQYLAFSDLRLRPAVELLARVPLAAPRLACDLGCGPGNSTALLARRWPDACIVGIDSSLDMLAKAAGAGVSAIFLLQDLEDWRASEPADLIFSNAALHWLGDHEALFPRLCRMLAPGGVLAVQMPRNHDAPSHRLMATAAAAGPWAARLADVKALSLVPGPAFYHDLLAPLSARIDIWETEYLQVLEGPDPVKEFTKSTGLRPYLAALDGAERDAFEAAYSELLAKAYPRRDDGRTLFPFKRLFIVAQVPG